MKQLLHVWPVVFIFCIWFLFASPYFVKGLIPFPSRYLVTFFPPWSAYHGMPVKNNAMPDVIGQIYPWKRLTIDSWKMGQVPLWNPYTFSGTPHAANYQTAVFSPFNALFFVFPEIDAWSLLILLQPLLAGLFMYGFLLSLDKSKVASTLGAISYMFCGFIVVWMAYGTLSYAVAYLPLILWGVTRFFKHPSFYSGLTITIGTALSFFSGHFQMSLYTVLMTIAYISWMAYQKRQFHKSIVSLLFFVSGIAISLPQILPSLVAYSYSGRSGIYATGGEIAWKYLITLFAPDFYGNPVTRNDWYGTYAEWASYVGVIPLILALFAVVSKRTEYKSFFILSAIVTFLLATPTWLTRLLLSAHIPAISTSTPSRIIALTSFSLAVLSSFGLDHLIHDWQNRSWKRFGVIIGVTTIVVGIVWMVVYIGKPFEADKMLIAKRNLLLPTLFFIVGVFVSGFGFLIRRKLKPIPILALLLLGISSYDGYRYASKWMPFEERHYIYPELAPITFLKNTITSERLFGFFGGELTNSFHLPGVEGYDAVYQERYGEFVQTWTDGKINVPERSIVNVNKNGYYTRDMLQLLGIRYYLHRLSDGHNVWAYPVWKYPFEQIFTDNAYEVYRDDSAYPRAFLASSYRVETQKQKIIDTLLSDTFDRRNTLVLETKPIIEPQVGNGTASIQRYTPNIVDIETKSDVPKLLFLSDVFDDGWRAYLDKDEVPIYRADYNFRAVSVPAGDHIIRFVYWPRSFQWGLFIAGVTVIVLMMSISKMLTYANRHI